MQTATQATNLDRIDNIRAVTDAAERYRVAGLVPPQDSDTRHLVIAAKGDGPAAEFAKVELIARCEKRLRKLISRHGVGSAASVDLEQAAMLGTLRALDKVDPDGPAAFFTYAHNIIVEELREVVRTADPKPAERSINARYWAAMAATDYDAVKARRWAGYQCMSAVELEAIAEETGDVIAREIVDARYDRWERNPRGREWEDVAQDTGRGLDGPTFDAVHASVSYLDAPVSDDSDDDTMTPHESIADPDGERDRLTAEDRQALRQLLATLDERDAEIIRSLFGFERPARTAADVAEEWGISRPRVMNIKAKALRNLSLRVG